TFADQVTNEARGNREHAREFCDGVHLGADAIGTIHDIHRSSQSDGLLFHSYAPSSAQPRGAMQTPRPVSCPAHSLPWRLPSTTPPHNTLPPSRTESDLRFFAPLL